MAKAPAPGEVAFGDLRRTTPVSDCWGLDRGTPVDRIYIERFLERHAADIRDHVLEFKDTSYTRRFGGAAVTRVDVINLEEGISGTTMRADIAACDDVEGGRFHCIVCTQVLQFPYDLRSAVRHLRRLLAPAGVLLVTVPGISYTRDRGEYWNWNFTPRSAATLFAAEFGADAISVTGHGNALTATAFLQGLAAEELTASEFEDIVPGYEIVVTIRAVNTRG